VSAQTTDTRSQAVSDSGSLLQRSCGCGGSCGGCSKKKELQRSALQNGSSPQHAPESVHDVLRSPGQPLDAAARADMEPRFGHDLSRVRVHADSAAHESASSVGAEAYTVGRHIVFGEGRYSPASHEGRSLLAHELAHTLQQRGSEPNPAEPLPISTPNDAGEQQADRMAEEAAASRTPGHVATSAARLSRKDRKFLLTFDDGPHAAGLGKGNNRTENVLDTLCDKNVRGAFYVQTAAVDADGNPHRGSTKIGQKLITRMNDDGHEVAVHTGGTKDHQKHTKIPSKQLQKELGDAKAFIKKVTGTEPTHVRPPTGAFDKRVSKDYAAVGLTNVLWDIDGDSGADLGKAELEKRLKAGIKSMVKGGWVGSTPMGRDTTVVLYHDIQKGSSKNLPGLIDLIKTETAAQSPGDKAVFPAPSCKAKTPTPAPEGKADTPAPKEETKPKEEPKEKPPEEKIAPSKVPMSLLDTDLLDVDDEIGAPEFVEEGGEEMA
jgi:peptidoglycan/xylan/chitin deacetylase (PgdA/CDA1 family)